MDKPLVSVLLSAFNVGAFIEEAIKSILDQTYSNFELLFIDDASTDDTWRKATLCAGDKRLKMFRNTSNIGVAASINLLLPESRGDFISRMDGDDVALPDRLEVQIEVLRSSDTDLLGGWMIVFGDGKDRMQRYPTSDGAIKAGLLFTSMFSQPTVTMRRDCLASVPYRESAGILEDYDLWTRVALHGATLQNLARPLVRHRRHPTQTSSSRLAEQWQMASSISLKYLKSLGIGASPSEQETHLAVRSPHVPSDISEVESTEAWLLKLILFYENQPDAQGVISTIWYRYCLKASVIGISVYLIFVRSPICKYMRLKSWQKAALACLCATRTGTESGFYKKLQAHSPAARIDQRYR